MTDTDSNAAVRALDRDEAVRAALLYVLQLSNAENKRLNALGGQRFIDALEQDGYTVTPTTPPPVAGEGLPLIDASHDCALCRAQSSEFYDLPGRCLNCGQRFTVRSRKGDKPPLSVECPSCEVSEYSWRAALSEPVALPTLDVERLARALRRRALPDAGAWADALPENRDEWVKKALPIVRADAAEHAEPKP